MQLYLITHAHTRIDQSEDATQWSLSTVGEQQAHILATQPWWPNVARIVLSSEPKTRLTIAPVLAKYNLPVLVDGRFDELYRPGWIEDYAEQVRRTFARPDQASGGWEAAAQALARFQAGIATLCQQYADATLALVGHGLTLSLYRAYLLGQPHVDFAAWQALSFAAVALVDPIEHRLLQDFQPVAGQLARG